MSDAMHTPGPWAWYERQDRSVRLATPNRGHLTVMDFVRLGMQGGTVRFATWEGNERENMGGIMRPAHELELDNHPDARLIAAAPDLLAACVAWQGVFDQMFAHCLSNGVFNAWGKELDCTAMNEANQRGLAAIAKAKGAK